MTIDVTSFLRQAGCICSPPRVFNRRAYLGCKECGNGYTCDRLGRPMPMNPGTCHYCGKYEETLTVDHIVPKALGGPDRSRNYVGACGRCNRLKADKRSSCTCGLCTWAWAKWGPRNWAKLPTVDLPR